MGLTKEVRNLVIRFHLEDDTVEVGEIHDVNSGRYKAPLFLKRCKLPKVLVLILGVSRSLPAYFNYKLEHFYVKFDFFRKLERW